MSQHCKYYLPQLIGLSKTSIAIYRENKTGINKQNLSNTASCVCWTADGLRFALGHENGYIYLKDKDNEKELKSLNVGQTIMCMSFSSTKHKNRDYTLIVSTWEKSLIIIEVYIDII